MKGWKKTKIQIGVPPYRRQHTPLEERKLDLLEQE